MTNDGRCRSPNGNGRVSRAWGALIMAWSTIVSNWVVKKGEAKMQPERRAREVALKGLLLTLCLAMVLVALTYGGSGSGAGL